MARRSDHSRDELRALILDAAIQLIAEQGVDQVSARQIAARIGYSPGTIYNIYENLDDLMLHVAGHTLARMRDECRAQVHASVPRDALEQLAQFYFRFTTTHEQLWRVVTEHRLSVARTAPRWYRGLINEVMSLVDDAVAPLVGPGDRNAVRRAALTVWASMQGICTVARSGGLVGVGERILPALCAQLVDTFVLGLEARRGLDQGTIAA